MPEYADSRIIFPFAQKNARLQIMNNVTAPAVSVIVVNWNGEACLSRCLASLSSQTYKNFELVLIDNASTDKSLRIAQAIWPDIVIHRQSENTGFAKANNIGAALARGTWIALLNTDAFPEEDWLENLLKAADQRPAGWFFTSRQSQANSPALLDGTGDEYHVSGLAWRRHYGEPIENAPPVADEVFSACGAAAMYPRQAFLDVGGFDVDFFAYLEDVDLAFRLRHQGYRCLYVPNARVFHIGSASQGKESEFAIYHSQRNMTWLYLKNMPSPLFWRYAAHHLAVNLAFFLLYSFCCCPCVMLRAKWDALLGVPRALAKRKGIQHASKVQPAALLSVMKVPRRRKATWRSAFFLVPYLVKAFIVSVRVCRETRGASPPVA
jgi:GT2 family glycosyltransferase